MITGLHANNNNRAETIFQLFREAIEMHGIPSRVRGDHGTENLVVVKYMEDTRGYDRGSYIWGQYVNSPVITQFCKLTSDYRSVHNTHIEHLWYNIMSGFGQSGRTRFWSWKHTMASSLTSLPTYGSSTTSSLPPLNRTHKNGLVSGITIRCKSKANVDAPPSTCSHSVFSRTAFTSVGGSSGLV